MGRGVIVVCNSGVQGGGLHSGSDRRSFRYNRSNTDDVVESSSFWLSFPFPAEGGVDSCRGTGRRELE